MMSFSLILNLKGQQRPETGHTEDRSEDGSTDVPAEKITSRASSLSAMHDKILEENSEHNQVMGSPTALQVQSFLSKVQIPRS